MAPEHRAITSTIALVARRLTCTRRVMSGEPFPWATKFRAVIAVRAPVRSPGHRVRPGTVTCRTIGVQADAQDVPPPGQSPGENARPAELARGTMQAHGRPCRDGVNHLIATSSSESSGARSRAAPQLPVQ